VADKLEGGIKEIVYDADGPAFLKMEPMGLGVDRYQ
jgi:hypothetical protein